MSNDKKYILSEDNLAFIMIDLIDLRQDKNISIYKLCSDMKLHAQTVGGLEKGDYVKIEALLRYCAILDMKIYFDCSRTALNSKLEVTEGSIKNIVGIIRDQLRKKLLVSKSFFIIENKLNALTVNKMERGELVKLMTYVVYLKALDVDILIESAVF